MKKAMILTFGLLLLAATANALPPLGYMALYADASHSICTASPAAYAMIEMWVWIKPGTAGVKCAEFKITYPATYMGMTVTASPLISVAQGDLPGGMSVCFTDCQIDWFWSHHQTIFCMGPVPGFLTLDPHPVAGGPQFANCAEGYPIEPAVILNHLALQQPCIVGVNNTSWGAIKNLYN